MSDFLVNDFRDKRVELVEVSSSTWRWQAEAIIELVIKVEHWVKKGVYLRYEVARS